MIVFIAGLVLVLGAQDLPDGQPAQEAPVAQVASDESNTELADLCEKLAGAGSYTGKIVIKDESPAMGRGGRDRGPREPTEVAVRFQKGKPYHFVSGDVEAYRLGDRIAYKKADGTWELFDRDAMRGGRGQRGGDRGERRGSGDRGEGRGAGDGREPRDRGDGGGGFSADGVSGGQDEGPAQDDDPAQDEKPAREGNRPQDGDRRGGDRGAGRNSGMRVLFSLSTLALPHEMAGKLKGEVTDLVRTEEGGRIIFTANLTEKGAQSLSNADRFSRMRGRGGEDGPTVKCSGSLHVVAAGDSGIESVAVSTKTEITFGERGVEMIRTTSFSLSGVGATEVILPEEAKALFEEV